MANDDDDDNDFFEGPEGLSDEEWEEAMREDREVDRRAKNHPLNIQAQEIMELVKILTETRNGENENDPNGSLMMESAMIIRAKLASALRTDSRLIASQNAAIIREHGEYLRLSNHMMTHDEGYDPRHVKMFRDEMEKFRELFVEWVSTFGQLEADEDDWGLFKWV